MITSQNNELLEWLKKNPGGITQLEATYELGITRLAARIADLKERGERIKTEEVSGVNRRGKKVNYARYYLVKSDG